MSVEVFPLVNELGNAVGQATRTECHSGSKLLHPVVHLHVFNAQGQLYLQKRSANKDIQPSKWDSSVGGHIGVDESVENAVHREAFEEIGLTGLEIYFIGKYIIETDVERELTYCFYAITEQTPKIDGDEVEDGEFWEIDEIASKIGTYCFTPNFESDFGLYLKSGIDQLKTNKS